MAEKMAEKQRLGSLKQTLMKENREKYKYTFAQEQYISSQLDRRSEEMKAEFLSELNLEFEENIDSVIKSKYEGLMDRIVARLRSEISDLYGINVRKSEVPEIIKSDDIGNDVHIIEDGNISDMEQINIKDINIYSVEADALSRKNTTNSIICRLASWKKKCEIISARKQFKSKGVTHCPE